MRAREKAKMLAGEIKDLLEEEYEVVEVRKGISKGSNEVYFIYCFRVILRTVVDEADAIITVSVPKKR